MSKETHQSLGGTTLVHEAFIRLARKHGGIPLAWDSRAHFFAAASEAMRRVIIDRARARNTKKRGGNFVRIDESVSQFANPAQDDEILAVDDALKRFSEIDPACAEVVKLKYFVGLSRKEIADALNISVKTVQRRWDYSKSWLRLYIERAISEEE